MVDYYYTDSDIPLSGFVEEENLQVLINFIIILGYGDSDNVDLSEMGVVNDSKFVLEWLIKTVNNSAPVFVWGHSLGTG